ncbi:MAG: RdgB/HAM1 family non-canonical purine NTP pyrophosphatase [Candidatus Symbiobacter sp.]|nr:RdgB/HAM1 family non-canonical purine NTP pyrophosphatase [Candidatus Symbiobacter sp.]
MMPPAPSPLPMAKSLLIATHNDGKWREFSAIFAAMGIECLRPDQFGLSEPEETGTSFRANAELKAKAAALGSNRPALADDSGLCVTALGGAPGIYSARWAGKTRDGKANFARAMGRINTLLAAHPDRSAQFVCALTLAVPLDHKNCEVMTVEGVLPGTIIYPPRGAGGFGYDSFFIPQGQDYGQKLSFAEIDPARKNQMSHRAIALRQLCEQSQFQRWLRS